MQKLEELANSTDNVNSLSKHDAVIFEWIAIVQMMQATSSSLSTYKDLALAIWHFIQRKGNSNSTIHIVFDIYFEKSVKSQTRTKRDQEQFFKVISY